MLNPVFRRAALRLRAFSFRGLATHAQGASPRGRLATLVALVVLAVAAACSEQLDSGATCGTLCPLANEQLRDTVFDPVALDTTLAGFPQFGSTRGLLLATTPGPDSVDLRAVIRFDSIPGKYQPAAGGDSVAITTVDSTYLRLRIDSTATRFSQPVTVEAYDVDTPTGQDTATATLASLFTRGRRIGTFTFRGDTTLSDSLRVPLSDSAFAAKARAGGRLRVGLRVVSTARAQLLVLPVRSGTSLSSTAPALSFDVATDTGYKAVPVSPISTTPTTDLSVAAALLDQSLVVRTPRTPAGSDLVVGGAPGSRAYIRFDLPIRITDSTDVVRAVLELTQRPERRFPATDTVRLQSEAVLATTTVTDLTQAVLLGAPSGLSSDTLTLSPADSGTRRFSLVTLVRAYRSLPTNTVRAVALRVPLEGAQVANVRFFSTEAPAAVRPRLRLTYIPRTATGQP